jgi:hypothetical protein
VYSLTPEASAYVRFCRLGTAAALVKKGEAAAGRMAEARAVAASLAAGRR